MEAFQSVESLEDLRSRQFQFMKLELGFFEMFLWGFKHLSETQNDMQPGSIMGSEIRKMAEEFEAKKKEYALEGIFIRELLVFLKKIHLFKPQIKEICTVLLDGAFRCKSFNCFTRRSAYAMETVQFLGFILENLGALDSKVDLIEPVKQQIGFIRGKLKLFRKFAYLILDWFTGGMNSLGNFSCLVAHWMTGASHFDKLIVHIRTWAIHVSYLVCLYWIENEIDESRADSMAIMLSNLMQKTMPYTPELIGLHLRVLKATGHREFETMGTRQLTELIARYVDFLLEDVNPPVKDDIEILREGLVFLLSFAATPPEKAKWLLSTRIDSIISDVPIIISSVHSDSAIEGTSVSKTAKFPDFLEKIHRVKAEIRDLYVQLPRSSVSEFPSTNAIGFLDFLLGTLQRMLEVDENFFFLSIKPQIEIIREELASLKPFLQNIKELQNEHEEFKNLWVRIINVVYGANYIVKLSAPAWYSLICISSVIQDIKFINVEVKQIQDREMLKNTRVLAETELSDAPQPPHATTSKIEGTFIGFKEDARSIIDHLVGGRKDLTIISISGMPGQGKTTLAKRIYNDLSIQYHFHKIAWCYISKEWKMKELLIKIILDVSIVAVNEIYEQEIQDLLEHLRKSLKQQRYLIVLDDIWDVDVWHEIENSFPDDGNGSRILFTSRNHNLASQAKPNSICHPLQLLSDEDSWELMTEKAFPCDGCPPEFLKIGKQIASYCKGLPLTVVLVASLIGRTERKLDSWTEVAEKVKSHLAVEGCMDVIELSYKHLPDHLKGCFLYFGVFPRGENIRAKRLKLLWIAEGFVDEHKMQSAERLAESYLDNLVSQNLVVVTERSSKGGIKRCNVHDLLYDFCLEKAKEENFLKLIVESDVIPPRGSGTSNYVHHRLCFNGVVVSHKLRPLRPKNLLPTGQVHSLVGRHFFPFSEGHSMFLNSLKGLNLLELEMSALGNPLPQAILSMVYLRHLALWHHSGLKEIPESIVELWNLETIIIEGNFAIKLPGTVLKMKRLRHVRIHKYFWLKFAKEEVDEKSSLQVLNIETLGVAGIDNGGYFDMLLKRIPKLRKLICNFEEVVANPSQLSTLFRSLNELESLNFECYYCLPITRFLPGNLKKLTLSCLQLRWSEMCSIGEMVPNLEVLKLKDNACKGAEWDLVEDGECFSKLRFLELSGLDVKQMNVSCESDPFPYLEVFVVKDCEHLEEIPSSFGDICTLQIIKVIASNKAAHSAKSILRQQRDMENHTLQVFIMKDSISPAYKLDDVERLPQLQQELVTEIC